MTMKKQIIYMVCATALLSSCHIYKAYDRPDTIETSGIYRDPVSATVGSNRYGQYGKPALEGSFS